MEGLPARKIIFIINMETLRNFYKMNMDKTACRAKILQNHHGKVAHREKNLQSRLGKAACKAEILYNRYGNAARRAEILQYADGKVTKSSRPNILSAPQEKIF